MQLMMDEGVATRRGVMTTHREPAYKEECKGISLPQSEYYSSDLPEKGMVTHFFHSNINKSLNKLSLI